MSEFSNLDLSEATAGPGALSIPSRNKLRSQVMSLRNQKVLSASSTETLGMTQQAGRLRQAWVMTDQALGGGGETCTIDIKIRDGGPSILVAPVVLTLQAAKEIQLDLPLNPAFVDVDAGSAYDVERTYVAGVGPSNPLCLVVLEYE